MDADMKSYRSYFKCIADNMLNVNWIVDNYVKKTCLIDMLDGYLFYLLKCSLFVWLIVGDCLPSWDAKLGPPSDHRGFQHFFHV